MYVLERRASSPAANWMTLALCQHRAPLEHVRRGLGQPAELRISYCPYTVEQHLSHTANAGLPRFYEKAG